VSREVAARLRGARLLIKEPDMNAVPRVTSPTVWSSLLERRRVVVCAGPGGVGKTTTAAALAVLGARRGLRVAALTVDPARRLADSLGIGDPGADPREVDPRLWRRPGQPESGRLTVMMMDTKRTFDEVVERNASSPEARDRILNNKLYQHVSAHLAGAHEYMAMEKLLSIKNDAAFDLIVLDTPPTRDALDFLSAPERLVGALDSSMIGWLGQALHPTRGAGLGLIARGVSRVLSVMGRITGQELLEQLAGFVVDLNELFGGFKQRATAVARAFRGAEFGFVLVSTTRPSASAETLALARQLLLEGMALDGVIVNRLPSAAGQASAQQVATALARRVPSFDAGQHAELVARIALTQAEQNRAAHRGAEQLDSLTRQLDALTAGTTPSVVAVPELPANAQGIEALQRIADVLGDARVSA
jgi:anion-transporting  ArsA/GET3 family ATPase